MKDDDAVKVYSIQRQQISVTVYAVTDENGNVHVNSRNCLDIYDNPDTARGVVERLNSAYERAKVASDED